MPQSSNTSPNELPRARLVEQGRQAAGHAYSPYSELRVGAAVLAAGQIYDGCNIENASFGLTACAERVAIFKAVSAGHHRIEAVFVTSADAAGDGPAGQRMPCGACRQVMAEFGGHDLLVIVDGAGEFRLRDLLPEPFEM